MITSVLAVLRPTGGADLGCLLAGSSGEDAGRDVCRRQKRTLQWVRAYASGREYQRRAAGPNAGRWRPRPG
ncbi:hypothetical protein GCM10023353_27170 [Tomitella cavernea]|uniref:Uncharacterized protein n=1 Tax=Tomitella cavernea TaxID=1387982 RepID=A0ABP9CUL5_9ACTN